MLYSQSKSTFATCGLWADSLSTESLCRDQQSGAPVVSNIRLKMILIGACSVLESLFSKLFCSVQTTVLVPNLFLSMEQGPACSELDRCLF